MAYNTVAFLYCLASFHSDQDRRIREMWFKVLVPHVRASIMLGYLVYLPKPLLSYL